MSKTYVEQLPAFAAETRLSSGPCDYEADRTPHILQLHITRVVQRDAANELDVLPRDPRAAQPSL